MLAKWLKWFDWYLDLWFNSLPKAKFRIFALIFIIINLDIFENATKNPTRCQQQQATTLSR